VLSPMSHAGELRARAEQAMQAWASFPAAREPRPIVLLSQPTLPGGFPDGQKKLAFVQGLIQATPGFPEDVLHLLRRRGRPIRQHSVPPLVVTAATMGRAEFATDRGWKQLHAWEVRARDVPEPIWVLDPAILRRIWQPSSADVPCWQGTTARQSADGRTVSMTFRGLPEDIAEYPDAGVLASGNAIAILPVMLYNGPEHLGLTAGQLRHVTVTLAQPLGTRVLLDEAGAPVMVDSPVPIASGAGPDRKRDP